MVVSFFRFLSRWLSLVILTLFLYFFPRSIRLFGIFPFRRHSLNWVRFIDKIFSLFVDKIFFPFRRQDFFLVSSTLSIQKYFVKKNKNLLETAFVTRETREIRRSLTNSYFIRQWQYCCYFFPIVLHILLKYSFIDQEPFP